MSLVFTAVAYAIGLPVGMLLLVTDPDGVKPNKTINTTVGCSQFLRSVPSLSYGRGNASVTTDSRNYHWCKSNNSITGYCIGSLWENGGKLCKGGRSGRDRSVPVNGCVYHADYV